MPSSTQASGQLALPLRLFLVLRQGWALGVVSPEPPSALPLRLLLVLRQGWALGVVSPEPPSWFLPTLDADFGCLCSYPSSQLHCLHLIGKAKVLLSFLNT